MDAMRMFKLIDKNGNDITAQQAYDAAMSGPVYVIMDNAAVGNHSIDAFLVLDLCAVIRENENIVSVRFSGFDGTTKYNFYAGENPDNIL